MCLLVRGKRWSLQCALHSYTPSQKFHTVLQKTQGRVKATHKHQDKVVGLLCTGKVETGNTRVLSKRSSETARTQHKRELDNFATTARSTNSVLQTVHFSSVFELPIGGERLQS